LEDAMTRKDIEHLAQVAESVKAQFNLDHNACDAVSARFLWAIRASKNNPRFSQQNFKKRARGESADIFDVS
jgi:hypothetical protein